jgi:D-alanine-D-alanine ligase-like ATP-grasp enzyme
MVVVADATDAAVVAGAAGQLATGHRLGAVLASSGACVTVAAQAAAMLGLRCAPAGPVAVAHNKFLTRQVLRRAGLAGPRYALLGDPELAEQVVAEVGLPAVVKPVNGTSSHLVMPVRTGAEVAAAYRRLRARVAAGALGHLYRRPLDTGEHGELDPRRVFLVEGMLHGREFSLDLVLRGGRVEPLPLVEKFLGDERFFGLGFVSPPFDLPAEQERRVRIAAEQAVRAVGLDNTVAHLDVIDDEVLGATVVEVNARPGGHPYPMLYRLTAGVDPLAELVAASRGVPGPRRGAALGVPVASLKVPAAGTGRLRAVHGLDEVAAHPDVLKVTTVLRPGDLITDEYEEFTVGVVVAGFLDRDDLLETYRQVTGTVRLELGS